MLQRTDFIMNKPEPLISVIIPAYNYANTLVRAAESVISQLDEYSELIIIDDGSSDETPAVIQKLVETYPGRFFEFRQSNAGVASVRNRGIEKTKSAYLIFLDADDEMAPGALDSIKKHIAQNPKTRLVICGSEAIYPDGRRRIRIPKKLPERPVDRVRAYLIDQELDIGNGSCVMHRDVFQRGLYPERFRNAEDIPVFAQALASYACTRLPVSVAYIYRHMDSLRHNLDYSIQVGDKVVEELFGTQRLPAAMSFLRKPFLAKRYLSLFRTYSKSNETEKAWQFYRKAIEVDWRSLFNWSYTRKAIKLRLKGNA